MKRALLIIALCLSACHHRPIPVPPPTPTRAVVVYLHGGHMVTGRLLSVTAQWIDVDDAGVVRRYYFQEITAIEFQ